VYSLGPDPIGNIALALFSGQPFPSNAFFLSCLSDRYHVTSTPQAYNFDVLFYNTLYFGRLYQGAGIWETADGMANFVMLFDFVIDLWY
jgi:hypothetical protein